MKAETKMGRPTDDPKTLSTRVRLSESDVEMLEACAKKLGITKAEVIRQGIQRMFESLENI